MPEEGVEPPCTVQLTTNRDGSRATESSRHDPSARTLVRTGPGDLDVEGIAAAVSRVAAKQRIVERLSSGDVRILAGDVRGELEAIEQELGSASATVVVAFDPARRLGG